jgi:hypothetical protein
MKKILALGILFLSLIGCSTDSTFQGMADDSTRDAVISDASIAIDEQNYDEAINNLEEIYNTNYPDPDVSRLLGSAYMGKAGLDVTSFIAFENDPLLDNIFDIANTTFILNDSPWYPSYSGNTTPTCDTEDLTVLMTSSGGQFIDGHCIDGMIGYLDKAKRVFYVLQNKNMSNPYDDIQYGIVSAIHFALLIGNDTADALNPTLSTGNPIPGEVPVPLNKRAYYLLRTTAIWSNLYNANWNKISGNSHSFYSTPLSYYQEDLLIMNGALEAYDTLGTQDYVKDDLEILIRDILQDPAGDISDSISTWTTAGITSYIQNVLSQ